MSFESRLEAIEKSDTQIKRKKIQTEERQKSLKENIKEIKGEIKGLIGVASLDKLDSTIERLEGDIETQLTKFEGVISDYEDLSTNEMV